MHVSTGSIGSKRKRDRKIPGRNMSLLLNLLSTTYNGIANMFMDLKMAETHKKFSFKKF